MPRCNFVIIELVDYMDLCALLKTLNGIIVVEIFVGESVVVSANYAQLLT